MFLVPKRYQTGVLGSPSPAVSAPSGKCHKCLSLRLGALPQRKGIFLERRLLSGKGHFFSYSIFVRFLTFFKLVG